MKAGTSPVDRFIGEKIRERRTELGMTQEQLADAISISYQQIQKYERGANRISAARLFDLARSLNVDITSFFPSQLGDNGKQGTGIDHGGRDRPTIELARGFAKLGNGDVKSALVGLVKTLTELERDGVTTN
ncbi:MAG: helix-turn-helix domain-containing protein [Geminicoccaceae bacterium]